ncbi:hypothetical protein FG386_000409 [Cryptosporidium ryanae]|uniref:uncharacterized protein n=1 Tax=Cryptosporidium ryanae TaxID=515981 RepID=UPI00351A6967|nr:hypothetical protein FG386_000409 [Cryptosporidium ryanae]
MEINGDTFKDVKLDNLPCLNIVSEDQKCETVPRMDMFERDIKDKLNTDIESEKRCKYPKLTPEVENSRDLVNFFETRTRLIQSQEGEELYTESEPVETENCSRIVMLDLDNTLIPTNWIMQRWRSILSEMGTESEAIDYCENENSLFKLTEQIRSDLVKAGLFDLLDNLFSELREIGKAVKIVIVTNAGIRTVELFYLKNCLPKLEELMKKYDISIRSTEEYIKRNGPPPSPFKEEEYREFYTNAKLCEFQKVLLDFWSENENRSDKYPLVDIISAGDQSCEMTAACRISKFYENRVRRTKLIYIYDPEDSRFWRQNPRSFVHQLHETHRELLSLLNEDSETLIGYNDMNSTGTTSIEEDGEEVEEVSLGWFCRGRCINVAISSPERFILPEGCIEMYLDSEKNYFKSK